MRGPSAVVVLAMMLVSAVTACTSGATSAQPSKPATAVTSTVPGKSQALGGQGCHPPSPITVFNSFLPQVEGTGQGATLWGLLMLPHALPARVGDQEKIVWRMTGTGLPLTLEAIGPDGAHHQPVWGPSALLSSDWDRPGNEWARVISLPHRGVGICAQSVVGPRLTFGFVSPAGSP